MGQSNSVHIENHNALAGQVKDLDEREVERHRFLVTIYMAIIIFLGALVLLKCCRLGLNKFKQSFKKYISETASEQLSLINRPIINQLPQANNHGEINKQLPFAIKFEDLEKKKNTTATEKSENSLEDTIF